MKKLPAALLVFSLAFPSLSYAESFQLPVAGCPMAHCDARMSGLTRIAIPTTASLVAVDSTGFGGGGCLGCSSNLRLVACSRAGDPPNVPTLVVYDGNGNKVWDDGGILNDTAIASAPMVGKDDTVIAADDTWIYRADPLNNRIIWQSAKPDSGLPISPVLVGSDNSMILLATASRDGTPNEFSIWDVGTGQLLSHQTIADPVSGKLYQTSNTPAVKGDRAYVVAEAVGDMNDGRLYAFDVCNGGACGPRGSLKIAWYYSFDGPSGSSPLIIGSTIYFDGRPLGDLAGSFMGVTDHGASGHVLWQRNFSGKLRSSAVQDPRGGFWIRWGTQGIMMRLNERTGETEQQFTVADVLGLDPTYGLTSVVTVSRSPDKDNVVLLFATQSPQRPELPAYLVALDVSTAPAPTRIWHYMISNRAFINGSAGAQFPIVMNEAGAKRIAFLGSKSSTFFVGEP
jgi:hypothetical protein